MPSFPPAPGLSPPSLPSATPSTVRYFASHSHTRWLGSKKFAIPSLILYSCPQFPHTSFPSFTSVSSSSVCRSRRVFSSSSDDDGCGAISALRVSGAEVASVSVGLWEEEEEERLGSGLLGGTEKPSCMYRKREVLVGSAFAMRATGEKGVYFVGSDLHGVPVHPWEDVDQEFGVVGDVVLLELGVFVVEGKTEGR